MAWMVFSGLFDRQPGLRVITHHAGGMIRYFEGRVGPGWDQMGKRTSDRDLDAVCRGLKRPYLDYFRDFDADPATFGSARSIVHVRIDGGGSVGMGRASELGQRGIKGSVIERYATPQPVPKGQNLTQRAMEHMIAWGAEAELRADRTVPKGYGIGGLTCYGTLLSGDHYDWLQRVLVRLYSFTDNERLPQRATEAVLRARVAQLLSVRVVWGHTGVSVDEDVAGVTLIARDAKGAARP